MLKSGRVIHIDHANSSGIILTDKREEYAFTIYECRDNQLPKLHEAVTFYRDTDFKFIKVAMDVDVRSLFSRAG